MSTTTDGQAPVVLDVAGLAVDFDGAPAVRGVDFTLHRGEVLGLVGESGSGKSATALAVLGLLPANARVRGSVRLAGSGTADEGGAELVGATDRVLSSVRGRRIGMVFQDPLSAFTPVYRIGDQIAEAIRTHRDVSRERARAEAVELLDLVGIPEPATRAQGFPHEFSGGMRQRAMIAMAVANDPDVIIADEPTTALDVTVQAQVLDVLRTAQRETGAALLLVSHDLGVIAGAADRVAVMYAGRVVETAAATELFRRPRMPYTLGLIGAVPRIDGPSDVLVPIPGAPPSAGRLPKGCAFAPRCPLAEDRCTASEPALAAADASDEGHLAACVRADEIAERGLTPAEVFPVPSIPERAASPANGSCTSPGSPRRSPSSRGPRSNGVSAPSGRSTAWTSPSGPVKHSRSSGSPDPASPPPSSNC